MPEVTEFLSKIAIPPRDALPLELQEVLKKVNVVNVADACLILHAGFIIRSLPRPRQSSAPRRRRFMASCFAITTKLAIANIPMTPHTLVLHTITTLIAGHSLSVTPTSRKLHMNTNMKTTGPTMDGPPTLSWTKTSLTRVQSHEGVDPATEGKAMTVTVKRLLNLRTSQYSVMIRPHLLLPQLLKFTLGHVTGLVLALADRGTRLARQALTNFVLF